MWHSARHQCPSRARRVARHGALPIPTSAVPIFDSRTSVLLDARCAEARPALRHPWRVGDLAGLRVRSVPFTLHGCRPHRSSRPRCPRAHAAHHGSCNPPAARGREVRGAPLCALMIASSAAAAATPEWFVVILAPPGSGSAPCTVGGGVVAGDFRAPSGQTPLRGRDLDRPLSRPWHEPARPRRAQHLRPPRLRQRLGCAVSMTFATRAVPRHEAQNRGQPARPRDPREQQPRAEERRKTHEPR